MAHRFVVPSSPPSSPAPSTPDRGRRTLADNPTATPAGPPPPSSSVASFTPAGAPSESYLGSSLLRASKAPSQPAARSPLGRSVRPRERQPSALSRQYHFDDDDDDNDEDEHGEAEPELLPPLPGNLFRTSIAVPGAPGAATRDGGGAGDDVDSAVAKYIDDDVDAEAEESESEASSRAASDEADMFLNMRHDDRPYGQPMMGEGDDMLMLNTPAATDRVRREAEDIFRRSTARLGGPARNREFQFATIARDLYARQEPARITESPELILRTEDLVCRLYDEGVGTEDDADKMDNSLANVAGRLAGLWNEYAEGLPQPEGEDIATVGPGPQTEPFEKAAFVAHLVLRVHHTRFEAATAEDRMPPLPEVLFDWLQTSHNLCPDQAREIGRCKPTPACHGMFWQTLRCAVLRGDVRSAALLLRNAGWDQVRRGPRGDQAYAGQALENIRHFAEATAAMLEQCPAAASDWDICGSSWTLFRVQARGTLDKLTLFAEGNLDGPAVRGPQSISAMARKAASQIPWDVYENLQVVYGIVLGNVESILDTAQDWCEATVGLFGWWDDGRIGRQESARREGDSLRLSQSLRPGHSPSRPAGPEDYLDRLAAAFHLVLRSDLSPSPINPVEVAIASAFEGNVDAVITCLRTWSLPVASSVAEIASLGHWLPPTQLSKPLPMDTLDMDDLALLGVAPPSVDEMEGIKDTTLVLYARELAGIEHLSPVRDGWELAIQVLGRMDSPEKADETVAELLRDLLETLDESSGATVDKMWRILKDLGMGLFAEQTAETFAQILSRDSHQYGEVLWYYALAHNPDKVREVLGLLTAYSLLQSRAFPAEADLDQGLRNLLRRRTETLETRAKQDLEAAQLLGRLFSGYATLRRFYEARDGESLEDLSASRAAALRKQAATALVAVISSADDSIRGGLHDEGREAVVREDFLLVLLGEATALVNQCPVVLSPAQIDVLLKAIEDLQTVGPRVYGACSGFFDTVLASCQGLRGSTPADLMRRSTGSLSGSSYVMSGSAMLASHLHQTAAATGGQAQRGWDWRRAWAANTGGEDVLRRLRLGVAKDLATLWLEDADGVAMW